ncbi:hypothetical protein BH24ACI3_BH24ACI3_03050 [soil metagenome]
MRTITFAALLLFGTSLIFGQTAISEAEYSEAYRKADVMTDSLPHRRTTLDQSFKNGKKADYEKHMTETLPPDRTRYVYEGTYDGEREDRQVIKIGEVSYCKEGKGKWQKTNCDRFTGLPADSIRSREYSKAEISLEGSPVTQFRYYFTYSFERDDEKKTVRNMYSEFKFVVDKTGRLVGSESVVGEIGSKEISSSSRTVYEYGLTNLKIEAPIK